jgi:O-antigen/teichoic acid export membrane protein
VKAGQTQGALVIYTVLAMTQRSMSLLLLPFVTRAMSVEEYGMVSILAAIGMFASVLMSAAVEQAVFRSAARIGVDPSQRAVLAAAGVWLAWIAPSVCGVAALTIYLADLDLFQIPAGYCALELLAIGIGLFPGAYVQACLRAQQRLKAFVVMSGSSIVVGVISKLALVVVAGQGVKGWVITDLCAALVALVLGIILLRPESWKLSPAGFRPLAVFALPIIPHVIAFWALASLSRPLMATVLPLSDVGAFAVAFNAANVGMLLAVEVNRAVAVDYAADSLPGPSKKLASIVRLQLALAAAVPLMICAASRPFVAWVVPSDEYMHIVPLLAVLSLGPYFWTVYVVAINFVTMTAGRPTWNWTASVSGTVVMAVGTVMLGSSIGVGGVALAQVMCFGVMAVVSHGLLRRMGLDVDWRNSGLTWEWWTVSGLSVLLAVIPTYLEARGVIWLASLGCSACVAAVLIGTNLRGRPAKAEASIND